MESTLKTCTGMDREMANLLLDPEAVPAKVKEHVAGCDPCRQELAGLRATMDLLDTWQGPEPSPYFLSRFDALMREERRAAPAGWFGRLRARFAYGSGMHVRPLAAMALTTVLLVGGGAYLGVTDWNQPVNPPREIGAVVHDLQTLDSNAQLLDQLEDLSNTNDNGD